MVKYFLNMLREILFKITSIQWNYLLIVSKRYFLLLTVVRVKIFSNKQKQNVFVKITKFAKANSKPHDLGRRKWFSMDAFKIIFNFIINQRKL